VLWCYSSVVHKYFLCTKAFSVLVLYFVDSCSVYG